MLSDEQLDAGIADMAYTANTLGNQDRIQVHLNVPKSSKDTELLDTVHAVLVNRQLTPIQKCLLMLMAWEGPRTAEQFAEVFEITSKSVQYSMRNLLKWGVVATDKRPDYTRQEFVRVYELVEARLEGPESDAE